VFEYILCGCQFGLTPDSKGEVDREVISRRSENVRKAIPVCLCLIAILVLSACAAGPNVLKNTPDENNGVAGFWRGLWHGFISPFTFIVSLFTDSVSIYEVHNNGGWYNFGFLLGVATFFGGGGAGGAASKSAPPDGNDQRSG
jgi:hypothetical protein